MNPRDQGSPLDPGWIGFSAFPQSYLLALILRQENRRRWLRYSIIITTYHLYHRHSQREFLDPICRTSTLRHPHECCFVLTECSPLGTKVLAVSANATAKSGWTCSNARGRHRVTATATWQIMTRTKKDEEDLGGHQGHLFRGSDASSLRR